MKNLFLENLFEDGAWRKILLQCDRALGTITLHLVFTKKNWNKILCKCIYFTERRSWNGKKKKKEAIIFFSWCSFHRFTPSLWKLYHGCKRCLLRASLTKIINSFNMWRLLWFWKKKEEKSTAEMENGFLIRRVG